MQLPQKLKKNFEFFFAFLKYTLNFQHIQKENFTLIANVFSKLRTSKSIVRSIQKRDPFRLPLDKQHGKRAEKHLKSERRQFYHIY